MKLALILILCVVATFAPHSPLQQIHRPDVQQNFRELNYFWSKFKAVSPKMDHVSMSVPCVLCGIVVNEVAGFIIENRTEQEIEDLIKQDICDHLGSVSSACDVLVSFLPLILNSLENQWSVSKVCVDLKLCDQPFPVHQDPHPAPKYTLNLDLPPVQRWTEICSVPLFKQMGQNLYEVISEILPDQGSPIEAIGELINDHYFPYEFSQEIKGCASAMDIPYGWVAMFNLGYELSDACTSIVAQTKDGQILHARSMDFWEGMEFTDTLRNMTIQLDYQKGGKTVFTSTTFAGMIGVLSGIKPGGFSATVDSRFYPGGIGELFYEVIAAIEERNASLVGFLLRKVLYTENNFQSALENLSNDELIADVYYILAGVSAGQGAVISRNRTGSDDIWLLDPPTRWFEIETNYDHWEPAPWFDDRIDPANDAMNALGQDNLSLDNMFKLTERKLDSAQRELMSMRAKDRNWAHAERKDPTSGLLFNKF